MRVDISGQAIGFVGLGVMGTPMATHLCHAGCRIAVHDLNMDSAQALARELGERGYAARSAKEVATRSDIVITMLPNGSVVQAVTQGEQGLVAGFKRGSILLDTSSSEPWLTKQTAQLLEPVGVSMIDAPVSGAQWGAEAAELVFMVGGEAGDLERVRPLLDLMGRAVFHLGPLGSGHAMKCINNLITAVTLSATSEGLVIGKAYGLDPEAMCQVFNESTAMSWISQTHIAKRILTRAFDDPFKLELMLKDMSIANALAREQHISAPISGLGQQLWQAAATVAGDGASISELVRWVEQQNQIEITRGNHRAGRSQE